MSVFICVIFIINLLLFVILLNSNMLLQFNSLYYTGMGDFAKFLLIYIVRDCLFIFKSLNVLLLWHLLINWKGKFKAIFL